MLSLMKQHWCDISFFHWRCHPSRIRLHLPFGLRVDTFDGSGWVSLTPFLLKRLRPPVIPSFLGLNFPETNLRTYVQGPEGPGIWFFSLDAAIWPAVVGARALYGLPYFKAVMDVQVAPREVHYTSTRKGGPRVEVRIAKGDLIQSPSALDHFLTARFRLYAQWGSKLIHAEVAHPPWPLHQLNIENFYEELRNAAGVGDSERPRVCHYSPGVETSIGPPQRLQPNA